MPTSRLHNVRTQGDHILRQMFADGKGKRKHEDKLRNNGKPAPDRIYVDSTLKTYEQGWDVFCDYIHSEGVTTRNIEELEPYVQPFADTLVSQGYAASTVHTWVSAVCKVLSVSLTAYSLPKRRRQDIKRSRNPVAYDDHFAAYRHMDLITYCTCVGPRNHKELQRIHGNDLRRMADGSYAVHIKGKGGRERDAPIVGTPEQVDIILALMRDAGDALVFPHVHAAADIHSLRAEYACKIYSRYARPIETLARNERYHCRNDMAGVVYDKAAMLITSEALGHSRLDVIALHYLWAL